MKTEVSPAASGNGEVTLSEIDRMALERRIYEIADLAEKAGSRKVETDTSVLHDIFRQFRPHSLEIQELSAETLSRHLPIDPSEAIQKIEGDNQLFISLIELIEEAEDFTAIICEHTPPEEGSELSAEIEELDACISCYRHPSPAVDEDLLIGVDLWPHLDKAKLLANDLKAVDPQTMRDFARLEALIREDYASGKTISQLDPIMITEVLVPVIKFFNASDNYAPADIDQVDFSIRYMLEMLGEAVHVDAINCMEFCNELYRSLVRLRGDKTLLKRYVRAGLNKKKLDRWLQKCRVLILSK